MTKKGFCWLLLLAVLLVLPVEGRSLFLQPKGQEQAAAASAKAISVSYPIQSFRLKFVSAKEFGEAIKEVLSAQEEISINEKLNTVVVRASEKTLKNINKIIGYMDAPPLQVQVEAKIIELKSGDGDSNNPSSLGVSWRYDRSGTSGDYAQLLTTDTLTSAASSLGLYAQLLSGNVDAYLSGLQKTIGYDLVASPWITALNHEEAEILIGSKYGYRTTLTTTTGTMQNIEFLEVGTKLKFTPHINEEGYVLMDIHPSVSEGQVVDELPQENATETKNKVLVKDGQSIIIGGLTKNYNSQIEVGVPILSHIPFLGTLFKRTEMVAEKRELMVVITPHIVTPEFLAQMSERLKDLEKRRQAHNNKGLIN
ncbi:type II secretion system protein GspD [Candidatus Margulisiibacteriota bacterium]